MEIVPWFLDGLDQATFWHDWPRPRGRGRTAPRVAPTPKVPNRVGAVGGRTRPKKSPRVPHDVGGCVQCPGLAASETGASSASLGKSGLDLGLIHLSLHSTCALPHHRGHPRSASAPVPWSRSSFSARQLPLIEPSALRLLSCFRAWHVDYCGRRRVDRLQDQATRAFPLSYR
jgi:hypothetical protein